MLRIISLMMVKSGENLHVRSASDAYQNDYLTDRLNAQRILAMISLMIPASLLTLFLITPHASDLVPNPLVSAISLIVIVQAAIRLCLNWKKPLNDRYQLVCAILDFVALSFILIAYAVTYNVPFSVALKSPTANIFFIFLTSRVILFNRSILLKTGLVAAVAWVCLVGVALLDPMFEGRTSSFTEYLTSYKVLIGAEVERLLQFGLITGVLYVFLQSIRRDPPTGFLRRLFFMGTISRFLMSSKSKSSDKGFAFVEIRAKNVAGVDKIYNTAFSLIPELPIFKNVKVVILGRLSDQSVGLSVEYAKNLYALPEILDRIHDELNAKAIAKLANKSPTLILSGCALNRDLSANRHLRYTGAAIRNAMVSGKSCAVFDDALLAEIEYKQSIEQAIKTGLETGAFSVAYQPIIDMMTDKPIGFESLIRLTAEDGTPISPADFIPVAESTGLISDITDYLCDKISEEGVEVAALYKGQTVQPYINVNISPSQLIDVNRVVRALKRAQRGGVKINVEITESAIFNEENAYQALNVLRKEGFSIAIDDFGTGYSSLQRLETLKFSTLKVDQSFVTNIGDPQAYSFLSAIINLARMTAEYTIVEGVETLEQKLLLMKMGVRYCQGYYWARPARIGALKDYLSDVYIAQEPRKTGLGL